MINAARAFDLRVVAEGIEYAATLPALRTLGCDDGQGYLIAKPMPAARVPEWLAEWRTGPAPTGRPSIASYRTASATL